MAKKKTTKVKYIAVMNIGTDPTTWAGEEVDPDKLPEGSLEILIERGRIKVVEEGK